MLNFLIAFVSQSYEDVMARKMVNEYVHKSELNLECMIVKNYFNQLTNFDNLIIFSESESCI